MSKPRIGVFVGSLSRNSINARLALALCRAGSAQFHFVPVAIADLPLYDRDRDGELPDEVVRLKAEISACDGFLFVTPEYNRSIPSALKNAIDWGSRPYGKSAWRGKPAALAGASSGALGTAIAQSHLRMVLTHLDMPLLAQPELYVKVTDALIAPDGSVADAGFAALLDRFVARFAAHAASAAGQ